jgi:hypothetical protein
METINLKPHGWHWWKGISNELHSDGHPLTHDKWYVVHCWFDNHGAYWALGAHFTKPMCQNTMGGEWGPEVIPPEQFTKRNIKG